MDDSDGLQEAILIWNLQRMMDDMRCRLYEQSTSFVYGTSAWQEDARIEAEATHRAG